MLFGVSKRLLVGRPVQSDRLGHTLLPKKIALPVFASDALSSVAYATEEILIVLSVGGLAFFGYTPWIALGVGLLMLVVVASYRQNVHAYPSGGGYYVVATVPLLIIWGLSKVALGDHLHAVSQGYRIRNTQDFTGFALVFLLLRAFSSGCT